MRRYLFDRLCQPDMHIPQGEQECLAWLRQSITQELQRLFGQRAFFDGFNAEKGNGPTHSVLNFGLNDLVSRSANFQDTSEVREELRKAIEYYEPRLLDPEINLIASNDPLMPATVQILGTIKTELLQDDFRWIQGQ